MINENGSFYCLSFVYILVLGSICFDLGVGGECLVFSAVCFTKLLLPDGLGGHRKNGGLNSDNPATSDRGVYFPILHIVCLMSVFLYNGACSWGWFINKPIEPLFKQTWGKMMVRAMQHLCKKAACWPEASQNRLEKVGQFLCLLQPCTDLYFLNPSFWPQLWSFPPHVGVSVFHIDIYVYCCGLGVPQKTRESSSYI